VNRQLWVRRACALVVAIVAAYASYEHQRRFALAGGADPASAVLWPLSVDGLVILASIGLLSTRPDATARARWSVRVAFLLAVAVSLVANIAAAPVLAWQPIVVAGWPPVALLLSVELLALRPRQQHDERTESDESAESAESGLRLVAVSDRPTNPAQSETETDARTERATDEAGHAEKVSSRRGGRRRAEEVMWVHFQRAQQDGREPTGAELDRVAGTNNYGRAVLARWRRTSRIPAAGAEATTRQPADLASARPGRR